MKREGESTDLLTLHASNAKEAGTRREDSKRLLPNQFSLSTMAIETLDIDELANRTGNLYETVAILSKRSRQVASDMRSDLDDKLSYFEGFGPEMEDARMQEEQAKVSLEFEKKPEPTEIAIDEFLEDKIYYRKPDE